jgi:hypothetical protein
MLLFLNDYESIAVRMMLSMQSKFADKLLFTFFIAIQMIHLID